MKSYFLMKVGADVDVDNYYFEWFCHQFLQFVLLIKLYNVTTYLEALEEMLRSS